MASWAWKVAETRPPGWGKGIVEILWKIIYLKSCLCPIFKAIVAGFRGKVASKNRTLGVPGTRFYTSQLVVWDFWTINSRGPLCYKCYRWFFFTGWNRWIKQLRNLTSDTKILCRGVGGWCLQSLCLGKPPSFDHLKAIDFSSNQVTIGETGISDSGEKVLAATNHFSNWPNQNDHPSSPRIMCFLHTFCGVFPVFFACLKTPSGWNFRGVRSPKNSPPTTKKCTWAS